ncbi:hypothetical protein RUE5091_03154 [Ruegeria denitrificans]|uniref:Uncharacterized protein n=1 Tax=Ruegeria denitrificans TaxID=1715692 RepID=A0A0P1IEX7_9RHOB|nr:hypothetical protein [Ruegeria denitrificans]CUK09243.1 hypothetical protein RUE5091_03154 [Ruegeria denitrificans]
MQWILRHLYLERRRLAVVGGMSFVAGATLYSHFTGTQMGIPAPIIIGFFYMVAVVVAAVVTTLLLPGLRRFTDAVAVTRLSFAVWVAATQSYELATSPLVSATIVVGGAIVLLQIGVWYPVAVRNLSFPQGGQHVTNNVRQYLRWLDNAAEYHADAATVFASNRRHAHG